jgi:hypothetical protein
LDSDVAAALAFVSTPRPSRETVAGLEVLIFATGVKDPSEFLTPVSDC